MLSVVVWQHIILFGSVCAWGASQVSMFLLVLWMFLINFNQWKCACVVINNWVILLRARYKCNHSPECLSKGQWQRSIYWRLYFSGSCPLSQLLSLLYLRQRILSNSTRAQQSTLMMVFLNCVLTSLSSTTQFVNKRDRQLEMEIKEQTDIHIHV